MSTTIDTGVFCEQARLLRRLQFLSTAIVVAEKKCPAKKVKELKFERACCQEDFDNLMTATSVC
jgi:hypothetical protein